MSPCSRLNKFRLCRQQLHRHVLYVISYAFHACAQLCQCSSNVIHDLQGTGSMDLTPPSTTPSLFNSHPSWQLSSADFLCAPPVLSVSNLHADSMACLPHVASGQIAYNSSTGFMTGVQFSTAPECQSKMAS